MKALKRRNLFWAAAAALSLLITDLLYVSSLSAPVPQTRTLLAVCLALNICIAGQWLREYRKMKTAQLIIENKIFNIRTAAICTNTDDATKPRDTENIEVFVSYFGILLDTKVIKFNQDGILLKAVEIGRDFISLTYGTVKRMQNTRLLCPSLAGSEQESIAEKFLFETGLAPVISNS